MPTYPYRCPDCDKEKEVIAKISESHDPPVCDCGTTMIRVFTPIPFTFGSTSLRTPSVSESIAARSEKKAKEDTKKAKEKYKSRYI